MIRLSFDISEVETPWRATWGSAGPVNPVIISETALCYKCFAVHVRFVIDDIEIISRTRGITLVDFALSLQYALKRLVSGDDASIGFTESDEVIRLQVEGKAVVVTSSKREWRVAVSTDEVVPAFAGFVEEAYSRLVESVPGLAENPVIHALRLTGQP
ncbi:hypothetical protein ACWEIJ_42880 [Lentzea sp. NPDC004789]